LGEYATNIYERTTLIDLSKNHKIIRKIRFLEIVRYLIFFLLKSNYFVFIDHRLHLRFGLPLLVSYLLKKNAYAAICHHVFYKIKPNIIRKIIEYLSEKVFLKNARFIVVPSRKTALDIQNLGVNRHNIVIINPTYTFKSNTMPRRKFHNKILFVGNLEPRKGVDIIIKALSLIRNSDFSFDIVGGFEDYEDYYLYLKKIIDEYGLSGKIKLHGRITQDKIPEFYNDANIFVFASKHEGYGTVLLEAMGFGVPIVATDIPTTREIVQDEVNGYLCPVDDIECISQRVRKLLDDWHLQINMGKRNFDMSRKFHSWDDVVKQTFDTFRPYLFNHSNK
jgi:glycosyltransferase involved in cell wall biosynthesis